VTGERRLHDRAAGPAAHRWASELAAWAIPEQIMAVAPESPWAFTPALFTAPAEPGPDTASRRRAREALPDGGWVLDVGCGGGAAGLALVPPAAWVTGFDQSDELLALFSNRAGELGVAHEAVQGTWPEDAGLVTAADVVVCHHVAYNVAPLAAFAAELTAHARVRVVMELTGEHPRAGLNHLWRHFWDVDRPTGPNADDAMAVLVEAGIDPSVERSPRVGRGSDRAARVASVRRYLCLPADRDPEIDQLLGEETAPAGDVVTLWWAGTA
jgi:SAM-dependent methyltransferase